MKLLPSFRMLLFVAGAPPWCSHHSEHAAPGYATGNSADTGVASIIGNYTARGSFSCTDTLITATVILTADRQLERHLPDRLRNHHHRRFQQPGPRRVPESARAEQRRPTRHSPFGHLRPGRCGHLRYYGWFHRPDLRRYNRLPRRHGRLWYRWELGGQFCQRDPALRPESTLWGSIGASGSPAADLARLILGLGAGRLRNLQQRHLLRPPHDPVRYGNPRLDQRRLRGRGDARTVDVPGLRQRPGRLGLFPSPPLTHRCQNRELLEVNLKLLPWIQL